MQLFTVILFVGISSSYAAPADPNPAQQEFQADLKNAMEPVQADVRAMVENGQVAVGDVSKSLTETGKNILEAGKSLLAPMEITGPADRANIEGEVKTRTSDFKTEVKNNLRSFYDQSADNVKSLMANEKSVLEDLGNAAQTLETKYLSQDGQDLVQKLSNH